MSPRVTSHPWYAPPNGASIELAAPPRLASWDRSTSPNQGALGAYLKAAEDQLRPHLAALNRPWALELKVGLPDTVDLLAAADLDNYLYPLVRYLTRPGGTAPPDLVSVRATKRHDTTSTIRVGPVTAAAAPARVYAGRTTTSVDKVQFKEQVRDIVSVGALMPEGAIHLEVSYRVGTRNWLNLWKPTLDALGPLLGITSTARPWHPSDGRITRLGLHVTHDPALRYVVGVQVSAQVDRVEQGQAGIRSQIKPVVK